MAARKRVLAVHEEWRSKIQTTMLLKRLTENVEHDNMSAGQIKSAEILLKKVIPDLKAIELTGADGGALLIEVLISPHADNPRQD